MKPTHYFCRFINLLVIWSLSAFAYSQVDYVFSTIDNTISQPTFNQKTEARTLWGLSEEEWARYEKIKTDSPWAIWEHSATPLSLLAFYSNSETERRGYARRQAELDQWREASVVLWQKLYDEERSIVHANFVASIKDHTEHKSISTLNKKDQVIVFIDLDQCEESCRAESRQVIDSNALAHLYFIGNANKQSIFKWALQMEIPHQRVKDRRITLNVEQGEGYRYGVNDRTLKKSNGSQTFFRHVSGVREIL